MSRQVLLIILAASSLIMLLLYVMPFRTIPNLVIPNSTKLDDTLQTLNSTTTTIPPTPEIIITFELYEAGHLRSHPELCLQQGADLKLVVLITTAFDHFAARDAIRMTWGHYALRTDIVLAFVVGTVNNSTLEDQLDREDRLYGDIIQGRSFDSYKNLTLKTLSILEWVSTYCPKAPFLLKTDDDMFINMPRLLQFVERNKGVTKTIWGRVLKRAIPFRSQKSKYYISPAHYGGKVYPDFTTGPAYLMTSDIIPRLLKTSLTHTYIWLEDVFVTGVVAELLGVKRTLAKEFSNIRTSFEVCSIQKRISIHQVQYHEQFDLWRKLLDKTTSCK